MQNTLTYEYRFSLTQKSVEQSQLTPFRKCAYARLCSAVPCSPVILAKSCQSFDIYTNMLYISPHKFKFISLTVSVSVGKYLRSITYVLC